MNLMKPVLPLVLFALVGGATPAFAAGMADQISVVDPRVRLAPPGARVTGAFMTLRNASDKAVRVVSADSAVAKITELHNHINDGGVMRMRQVKEIAVPAKGEVLLKSGSYHVMLIDMNVQLREGDTVVITLGFADGSKKTVAAPVKMPTAEIDHGKMRY